MSCARLVPNCSTLQMPAECEHDEWRRYFCQYHLLQHKLLFASLKPLLSLTHETISLDKASAWLYLCCLASLSLLCLSSLLLDLVPSLYLSPSLSLLLSLLFRRLSSSSLSFLLCRWSESSVLSCPFLLDLYAPSYCRSRLLSRMSSLTRSLTPPTHIYIVQVQGCRHHSNSAQDEHDSLSSQLLICKTCEHHKHLRMGRKHVNFLE